MVKKFRRSRAGSLEQAISAAMPICEPLENRQLFAVATGVIPGPILAHPSSPATDSIDLSTAFTDSTITGTVVEFQTSLGPIDVALTDTATPITVANFLAYLNSGAYDNTIFHRNAVLSNNTGGSPKTPADIVQGGGYKVVGDTTTTHIPTNAAIADEYTTRVSGNVAGTLAMAKTASANSATSEFYFNVHSNTSLDTPTSDTSTGALTSYTIFGKVVGNGMAVVDALAALPTLPVGSNSNVPVTGISQGQAAKFNLSEAHRVSLHAKNLTYLNNVSVIPKFAYTASSDAALMVRPRITGNTLSFDYASGQFGTAAITVTATSVDGTSASETFTITVPNTAAPAATVTATADAQTVFTGVTSTLHPLVNDSDSLTALAPSKLTVVTQPAHGTATVNTVTGQIIYNPASGYTGPDSFAYTVADTAGTVSSSTTFSLAVAAAQATVTTLGSSGVKELVVVQPNGKVARLTLSGGTAVVAFADSNVTTTTLHKVVTVRGTGATISSILITNTGKGNATLHVSGGATTIGTISDTGSVAAIDAPNVQLTSTLNVGGLGTLLLASTQLATLTIGSGFSQTNLLIGVATDTSVLGSAAIKRIVSKRWVNTDGLASSITASSVDQLQIGGEFADGLILTGDDTIDRAQISGSLTGGAWSTRGGVKALSAKSVASTWSLTSLQTITSAAFRGDFDGSLTADTIGKLSVGGAMHASSIISTTPKSNGLQIGKINVHGAITNSKIIARGTIGSIRAGSMSTSQVDAGVSSALTNSRTLPSAKSSFVQPSVITSVQIGGQFSNSVIAAPIIRSVRLNVIQTSSDGSGNGVAGVVVDSLTGGLSTGGRVRVEKSKLKTAAAALHNFSVNLLTT